MLNCSGQQLGMFPCILLALLQILIALLHCTLYRISSPTFFFPFLQISICLIFLQTSIQTCSVITSRQVCIQPHAVFFTSLYSHPIPLPENVCILSCDKHYFQNCQYTLQESRVIPDVFWFSAHFLLLPPVTMSAPLVHSVFRIAHLHDLAATGTDHLLLQQLTVLEKSQALLDFQEHKKKVVTIPFTPTRPISNNAAGIFCKSRYPLSYLCTAYSHNLLLLPLFPTLSALSCSFQSITLSFTLHAYV